MEEERKPIRMIYRTLWPLVILAKGMGILPWKFDGERLTKAGYFGRAYSGAWIVFVIFHVNNLKEASPVYSTNYLKRGISDIATYEYLVDVGLAAQVVIHLYRECTDPESGISIIKNLARYDRKVAQLGCARKDRFLFFWIMTAPIFLVPWFLILPSGLIFSNAMNHVGSFLRFLSAFAFEMMAFMTCSKFCAIAELLNLRYKHLNECVLPNGREKKDANMAANRRVVNMHDLVYLHSTLTTAAETLAKTYSYELFVWCGEPICRVVRTVLFESETRAGILSLFALLMILSKIIIVCWECHVIAEEANKFGMEIFKTDPELIRLAYPDESLDAALYLHNHKISFKVAIFHHVNLTTLLHILGVTLSFACIYQDRVNLFLSSLG